MQGFIDELERPNEEFGFEETRIATASEVDATNIPNHSEAESKNTRARADIKNSLGEVLLRFVIALDIAHRASDTCLAT